MKSAAQHASASGSLQSHTGVDSGRLGKAALVEQLSGSVAPRGAVVAGFQVAARYRMLKPAREGEGATVAEAHLAVGRFVVADLDAATGQPDQFAVASGLRAALPESLAGVGEHKR